MCRAYFISASPASASRAASFRTCLHLLGHGASHSSPIRTVGSGMYTFAATFEGINFENNVTVGPLTYARLRVTQLLPAPPNPGFRGSSPRSPRRPYLVLLASPSFVAAANTITRLARRTLFHHLFARGPDDRRRFFGNCLSGRAARGTADPTTVY